MLQCFGFRASDLLAAVPLYDFFLETVSYLGLLQQSVAEVQARLFTSMNKGRLFAGKPVTF